MSEKPEWALAFEEEARFENHKPLLLRKGVRYNLSRLRTEAEGGEKASPPEGFVEFFEEDEHFDGWENWGVTWDSGDPFDPSVPEDDPLKLYWRDQSIHEEWEEVLNSGFKADIIAARRRARIIRLRAKEDSDGSED